MDLIPGPTELVFSRSGVWCFLAPSRLGPAQPVPEVPDPLTHRLPKSNQTYIDLTRIAEWTRESFIAKVI